MPSPYTKNTELVCPLCHHKEYNVLFTTLDADRLQSSPFEIVRCKTCNLAATRPFLTDEFQHIWYRLKYHGWWKKSKRHMFSIIINLFQKIRCKWVRRYVLYGSRLLDIGYGDGTFINYISNQGYETYGIENPDFFPQSKANGAFGDVTINAVDSKTEQNISKVDMVTLWHVLEHVSDPLSTLQNAHDILNSDGMLIISFPNFNSVQSALFRDKWFHLDVPRHRWHFCPSTMTKLLQKSGFSVIHLSHFSLEYNPFGWFQSLLNLFHCSHNFAYNLFKRGEIPHYNSNYKKKLFDVFCTILLSSVSIPASGVLSLLESIFYKGGTVTIAAQKVKRSSP